MDGSYHAVTFICSKTDDISRTEAAESLQIDTKDIDDRVDAISRSKRALSKDVKDAKASKRDYVASTDAIDDEIETWEDLLARIEDGKTVNAPRESNPKKRRRGSSATQPRSRQRQRISIDEDDDDTRDINYVASNSGDEAAHGETETTQLPLSEQQAEAKIEELKGMKKEARKAKRALDERIQKLEADLEHCEAEEAELDAKVDALCIAGRNEYSRSAIQQDFAAGIRELDQETAEEEGEFGVLRTTCQGLTTFRSGQLQSGRGCQGLRSSRPRSASVLCQQSGVSEALRSTAEGQRRTRLREHRPGVSEPVDFAGFVH